MRPSIQPTWVLICDASRARLFTFIESDHPWLLLRELEHPSSRLKAGELQSDRPGRTQHSTGDGQRSAMEPQTDPQETEAIRFAVQLARELERGLEAREYGQVVLVAPPHFLGLLRQQLPDTVAARVRQSYDKDYTQVATPELPRHLPGI